MASEVQPPALEGQTSMAPTKQGTGLQVPTLMALPTSQLMLHLPTELCQRESARKTENHLLSTTRMPGSGGLGGAASSSAQSGGSSADGDMAAVLFRISTSRSVRGSSDWLRIEKNLGYRRSQSTGRSGEVGCDQGRGTMGAGCRAVDTAPHAPR